MIEAHTLKCETCDKLLTVTENQNYLKNLRFTLYVLCSVCYLRYRIKNWDIQDEFESEHEAKQKQILDLSSYTDKFIFDEGPASEQRKFLNLPRKFKLW